MRKRGPRFLVLTLVVASMGAACSVQRDDAPPIESKRSALSALPRLGAAIALASGGRHSCAILATGEVACWGANELGQLGTGDKADSAVPIIVAGVSKAVSIAAGVSHTCAVLKAGNVVCWGDNVNGALGDGTKVSSPGPVTVVGLSDATSVAAGDGNTCALRRGGGVVCWGDNEVGKLGIGSSIPLTTAVPLAVTGLSDAVAIAASRFNVCAVRAGGGVVCWGASMGTTQPNLSPVAISGVSDAVSVAVGSAYACALRGTGGVACWGTNDFGELGNGTTSTTRSATAVPVTGLNDAVSIASGGGSGGNHSCAARSNGQVVCWGGGTQGQLGTGGFVGSSVPVAVGGITDAAAVVAAADYTCALRKHGQVSCWGKGDLGQLGNGQSIVNTIPAAVMGLTDATSVSTTLYHTCAVRAGGQVVCWGQNFWGKLGNGSTADSPVPVGVSGLSDAVAVAAGPEATCALRTSGEVVCWGLNQYGELGDGTIMNSLSPVTVAGLSDAVSIVAEGYFGCALRATGGVVCWGFGRELGYGNTANSPVPVAVAGLSDAVSISAGSGHTCALRATGQVTCWGYPGSGALGDGNTGPLDWLPVTVAGLSDAVSISAGGSATCALRATGGVVCWGLGLYGQLGNGWGAADAPVPIPMAGVSNVKSLALGYGHACAVLASGATVCWGSNWSGQLGNGTTVDSSAPVTVVGLSDAVAAAGGGSHTCALRRTGEVACWGDDQVGQIGNGSPWRSNVPVAVLGLAPAPDGHACGVDAECAHGYCVDGVCCESACNSADPHRCSTCAATPGTCTAVDAATQCYTRQSFCESVEPTLTCGGALTCPTPTSWDGCSSSSNPKTLFGGVDRGAPACNTLSSGGIEVTFTPAWNGTIAARRVKSGCPDKPGFDLLPENDTSGQGYYWEIKADPPITCAAGQMDCVNMQVCVQYDEQWIIDAGWGNPSVVEGNLQLLHGTSPAGGGDGCDPTGNGWMPDTTTPVDTCNNVVCVPANTLSPFGLFIPKPGSLPTLQLPAEVVAYATSASGATVTYAATASDAKDGTLTPTCVPASGTNFAPGNTTVECTAVDSDSTFAKGSFPVHVRFQAPGDGTFFGEPINADGSSIFKKNSTIPVKFRLTGASAGITNLVAKLYTAKISNGVTGSFVEAETNGASDAGNTFRNGGGQYIYNLSTKSMTTGTWLLRVDLGDGVDHSVKVSLK